MLAGLTRDLDVKASVSNAFHPQNLQAVTVCQGSSASATDHRPCSVCISLSSCTQPDRQTKGGRWKHRDVLGQTTVRGGYCMDQQYMSIQNLHSTQTTIRPFKPFQSASQPQNALVCRAPYKNRALTCVCPRILSTLGGRGPTVF